MAGNTYARGLACEIAAVAFAAAGWPLLALLAYGAAMGIMTESVVHCVSHEGRLTEPELHRG